MPDGWLVSRWLYSFKSLFLPLILLAYIHVKKWNDLICYFHTEWVDDILSLQVSVTQTVQLLGTKLSHPGATVHQGAAPEKPLRDVCLLNDVHMYCPTLMQNCKVYLRLSNISVIPALSASSSILNLASSWSSFLKCRSTCFKEDQR